MPQIKQYDAPDLGLRPTEAGISATAAAARRIGAEYSDIAASKAATGHAIGSAISTAGEVGVKYLDHQQISQGANAFANLTNAKSKQWDDIAKNADPNDPTVAQRFLTENLEPDLEKFKSSFITENSQRWAETRADSLRTHMFSKTSADMATMAGQAAVINSRRTINGLSSTVTGDPSSLDFALKTLEGSTDAIVGSSPNLTGAAAGKVRSDLLQRGKEEIVKSAAMGYIQKTGEVPPWATDPKYAPYIDGTDLKQLAQAAKYYQRLSQSEDRAARVTREYDVKLDFHRKINELEAEATPKNEGEPPTLPKDAWNRIRQLSTHEGAELEPGRLKSTIQRFETLANRLNKPEPLAAMSHSTTVDLLRQMRTPDDTRINTLDPIYKAYDEGKLNNADFGFLKREFNEMRTPEGEPITRTKKDFFSAVGPSIDKSNPLQGKLDQSGKMQLYRMEWDINKKINEYRQQNKNPFDLFDPSKPDYVGRPDALVPYKTPLSESTKSIVQSLKDLGRFTSPRGQEAAPAAPAAPAEPAPAAEPKPVPTKPIKDWSLRKPGESPADYMKRMERSM